MAWRALSRNVILDLNTLDIGDRVHLVTDTRAYQSLVLEKQRRELISDTLTHLPIVDATGKRLEGHELLGVHGAAGRLNVQLASHYFAVNGDSSPVDRYLGCGLFIFVPNRNPLAGYVPVRIKTVEVWRA